ncbi:MULTISPECIES: WD40 repeat domain-containing protein [unclassified Nostoc]|uniref:WD40 repeat domain-containing protein n=1 Tax=unclassified Nostoc TaxID=2593658 RepID=UPI000B95A313|nr:hypothetical protein [Nostoc sp. 'Peltigera membranacea cyanobiont' 232]OYE02290.1 hypothetical protein CDG79_24900 [Nostoc sp. 'Peltigera membranacea cyanobiont' 232]
MAIAFSPDGKTLFTSGYEKIVKHWDFETGNCLQTLRPARPYEGMITALPAAMGYILKAERYARRGARRKTIFHNSRKRCITEAIGLAEADVATLKALGALEVN